MNDPAIKLESTAPDLSLVNLLAMMQVYRGDQLRLERRLAQMELRLAELVLQRRPAQGWTVKAKPKPQPARSKVRRGR